MRSLTLALAVALLVAPFAHPALAADYDVQPIGEKGKEIGCMAINQDAGLAFVAVAQNLSVMMTTKDFKVVKGDPVDGAWSVDGSKDKSLSEKADGPGTVSADMEATAQALSMIANGKELTATVGKSTMVFDLSGSKQALMDLGACMDKIGTK
jgi:hypothetical protein